MKLATYGDGSRDGQLVVVSRDLAQAHYASGVASRLQQVLEDWNFFAPQLQELYDALNAGRARHAFAFDARQCLSPLPRACRWARADAYPGHGGQDAAAAVLLRHGAGDAFAAPAGVIGVAQGAQALGFAAGLAVVTGDVARGAAPEQAAEGVRLLTLALSLEQEGEPEALATAFGPVAVTPDELGAAWRGARAALTLQVLVNGRKFGLCETGPGMALDFGALIARLACSGPVAAGGVVGALPVRDADAARGFCSLADRRAAEARQDGQPATAWLQAGDALRIEAKVPGGDHGLFGAIDLRIA